MAFSKIILNNDTLVDLTDATASASNIEKNYTAYIADGSKATGTKEGGGAGGSVTQDQDGFIVLPPDGGSPSGGGSFPNLMNFEEVLIASTATEISVQLTPSNNCAVLLLIKDIGEPDATMYKSLYWTCSWFNGGGAPSIGNGILRPNGTIGSDGGQASFDRTTGVFKFGNGSYGKAFAGDTYYIYQFSVGE